MDELKAKIYAKMQSPTLASFATVTPEGKPWSRYVVIFADEELNVWLATFKESRKVLQIGSNPEVHLNFGVAEFETAESWVQVQGKAEILTDAQTKQAKWYPHLEQVFSGPDDPMYVVCKIVPYHIEYRTMTDTAPEIWES